MPRAFRKKSWRMTRTSTAATSAGWSAEIPHASLDVIGKFVDVLQCEPAEFLRLPEKRSAARTPRRKPSDKASR
jgi:hypothetical protein